MHSRLKRALPIINLRGEISMLAARAAFKDAERIRRFLLDRGLFAKDRAIGRDANCVFFPVKEKFKPPGGCQLVERALEVRSPRMDWKKSSSTWKSCRLQSIHWKVFIRAGPMP